MFKNETERAFVLVLLLCGFIAVWIVVKDLALSAAWHVIKTKRLFLLGRPYGWSASRYSHENFNRQHH